MGISEQIVRIQTDRNTIRTKLIALKLSTKGGEGVEPVAITATSNLDDCASAVDAIINNGSISATVKEGETYTIPKGYHDGTGTVSGIAGGGNYALQSKTVTPTKSNQEITPDHGYYGISDVTVEAIPEAYQDVTSVTATADDVLATKTIVDKTGAVVAGTMVNNGSVKQTIDIATPSYIIHEGYHDGTGVVNLVAETKSATPTKKSQTVEASTGKVLSSVTVEAIPAEFQDVTAVTATADKVLTGSDFVDATGNVVAGTMVNNGAVTKTLDTKTTSYTVVGGYHNGEGTVSITLEEKSVTPTKAEQTVTPANGKVLSSVTVAAIPAAYQDVTGVTATAADVVEGTYFVDAKGVKTEGTIVKQGAISGTLDTTTTSKDFADGLYAAGSVNIVLEEKTATPTKSAQDITPTAGKVISKVTVAAIPAAYQDVTAVTAGAADVLVGKKIVDADGAVVTGTMANNGDVTTTIDGLTTTSVTIAAGYTSGGTVSLTNDIETQLAAI